MPDIKPLIRLLEPADVPALLTIIADSRAEYGLAERVADLLEPADRALYATYQRQRSLYFVALLDGEIVGGAGVAPLQGADPLTCELQRMYLRRDARGRGIGNALLEHCLKAARQFLYVRCYLETITQMREALGFYNRNGFRDLDAPLGRAGHEHNDRWLLRPLRASGRERAGTRGNAVPCVLPDATLRDSAIANTRLRENNPDAATSWNDSR
jgi:putative acetyltransferase